MHEANHPSKPIPVLSPRSTPGFAVLDADADSGRLVIPESGIGYESLPSNIVESKLSTGQWLSALDDIAPTDVESLQIGSGNIWIQHSIPWHENSAPDLHKRSHGQLLPTQSNSYDSQGLSSAKRRRIEGALSLTSFDRLSLVQEGEASHCPQNLLVSSRSANAYNTQRHGTAEKFLRPAALHGDVEDLSLGPGNPYN